jgi:eukaryotic-like serine/threonine-protein kinase
MITYRYRSEEVLLAHPSQCVDDQTAARLVQGALPAEEQASLERHIDGCPACSTLLAELARVYGPHAPRLPEVGLELGRYTLLRRLGSGKMGVVFEAHDSALARRVALKLVHPDALLGPQDDQASQRLVREAHAMARLSAPNVVQVYDVGNATGHVFVAMELVAGVTLDVWLTERPRSDAEILAAFEQAGQGLAAAHTAGLVHRDFKPANVLVTADGRVKVGDFGLTRWEGHAPESTRAYRTAEAWAPAPAHATLTATGSLIGTPAYMSPEQLFGRTADARSDQFAFAVALWEALYGARPFAASSFEELRWQIAARKLQPARRHGTPAAVRGVLLRALDIEPARRFGSIQQLLAAVRAASLRSANAHVGLNLIFSSALFFAHFALSAFFVNAMLAGGSPARPAGAASGDSPDGFFIQTFAYLLVVWAVCTLLWAPIGLVWTPVNVWGLWRRKRWARISTLIYAIVSLPTCLATPYAVYALISLNRRAVRAMLDS